MKESCFGHFEVEDKDCAVCDIAVECSYKMKIEKEKHNIMTCKCKLCELARMGWSNIMVSEIENHSVEGYNEKKRIL